MKQYLKSQLLLVLAIYLFASGGNTTRIRHPKLFGVNDTDELQGAGSSIGDNISTYIVVIKETREAEVQGQSTILDFLLGAASNGQAGDKDKPLVASFTTLNIGYTVDMNDAALLEVLEMNDVDFVEKDRAVWAAAIPLQWHMDRVDQRQLPLDTVYNPKYTGAGVDIYILDTGIRYSHTVFGGRAAFGGYDHFGGNGEDCQSHGTHVAGLAGGNITGAAVGANLYSIKVLGCDSGGSYAGVIAGINHAVNRAKKTEKPSILSMSLTGPTSRSVDIAISQAAKSGVTTVVAAGNFQDNACKYSPASSSVAITVGGTREQGDGLYWFQRGSGTNHGNCVDIFAPGQWVRSASHLNDTGIVSKSGTSMATPIVSGVVAMLLEEDPSLTPEQVKEELIKRSTKDVLDFGVLRPSARRKTPNRLVYAESKLRPTTPPPTTRPTTQATTRPITQVTARPTTQATTRPTTQVTARPTTQATTQMNTQPTQPPTKPETLPLPDKTSMVSIEVKTPDLVSTIRDQLYQGYVPVQANVYRLGNEQYFSMVYQYMGREMAKKYLYYTSLDPIHISFVRRFIPRSLKASIVVPYTDLYGRARVFLVYKPTADDIILTTDRTRSDWVLEEAEMRRNGYGPISVRSRLDSSGVNRFYTIYKKQAHMIVTWDLTYEQLVNYMYREKLYNNNNAMDITFTEQTDRTVRYIVTLDKRNYGQGHFFVDVRNSKSNFLNVHNILRSEGVDYHLIALTPTFGSSLRYVGIYWH